MPPQQPYEVTVPGWEDIIHVIPDWARAPEELREIKRERARRIQRSPTPGVVQSVREILTWIDDVQDALVTLSVASRAVVARTARALPYAKWIARGADLLNITAIAGNLGLTFSADKRGLADRFRRNPGTYGRRLLETRRTRKVRPTFGEFLQIAQTTDSIFGVGVSLGAIMSLPIDILFTAIRGGDVVIPVPELVADAWRDTTAGQDFSETFDLGPQGLQAVVTGALGRGGEVRFKVPSFTSPVRELAPEILDRLGVPRTTHAWSAAETAIEAGATLGWYEQDLSFDDHLAVLTAQNLAWQHVALIHAFRDWSDDALLKQRIPIRRHLTIKPDTARAMQDVGLDPRDPGRVPLPDAPPDATWGDVTDQVAPRARAAARGWVSQAPTPEHGLFAATLLDKVALQQLTALEGPWTRREEGLTLEALAAVELINSDAPPDLYQSPDALAETITALTDTLRILGTRRLPPESPRLAATAALARHPLPRV